MFVWAQVPEPWRSSMSTMDFALKLLEEGNVAVSPGSGFGAAGEGFLRMSLVENEQRLRQAVRHIGKVPAPRPRHGDIVAYRLGKTTADRRVTKQLAEATRSACPDGNWASDAVSFCTALSPIHASCTTSQFCNVSTPRFVTRRFIVDAFLELARIAEHRVLLQGGKRLAIIDPDGTISWEMPWGGIHDIHLLDNGNILTREGTAAVVEIDRDSKQVVWRYDAAKQNGNEGKRVEVHAFERLGEGSTMIAESGVARIIEVDRDGNLQKEIPLVVDNPSVHSDTRLVRRTRRRQLPGRARGGRQGTRIRPRDRKRRLGL